MPFNQRDRRESSPIHFTVRVARRAAHIFRKPSLDMSGVKQVHLIIKHAGTEDEDSSMGADQKPRGDAGGHLSGLRFRGLRSF